MKRIAQVLALFLFFPAGASAETILAKHVSEAALERTKAKVTYKDAAPIPEGAPMPPMAPV